MNGTLTESQVWERPLGVSFSDRLKIERAKDHVVRDIYQNHHSYIPRLQRGTICNHVAILDDNIVGAITYAPAPRSAPILGYSPGKMADVARVCVAIDMPNLASCMMAKSQDKFCKEWAFKNGRELLFSFVHEDWNGTMFSALKDKGWKKLRDARVGKAGNQEYTGIEDVGKTLWACEISDNETHKQKTLGADYD